MDERKHPRTIAFTDAEWEAILRTAGERQGSAFVRQATLKELKGARSPSDSTPRQH